MILVYVLIFVLIVKHFRDVKDENMQEVDGYKVRDPTDTESLRRLKRLSEITIQLQNILRKNIKYATHPGCKKLLERFECPDGVCRIQEKSYEFDHLAAYSVDKGKLIGICTKHEGEYVDENTMIFVYLHELSHIMSEQYAHDDAFWNNFAYLLEIAISHNLYVYQPFHMNNVNYCGENIEFTPYIPKN